MAGGVGRLGACVGGGDVSVGLVCGSVGTFGRLVWVSVLGGLLGGSAPVIGVFACSSARGWFPW